MDKVIKSFKWELIAWGYNCDNVTNQIIAKHFKWVLQRSQYLQNHTPNFRQEIIIPKNLRTIAVEVRAREASPRGSVCTWDRGRALRLTGYRVGSKRSQDTRRRSEAARRRAEWNVWHEYLWWNILGYPSLIPRLCKFMILIPTYPKLCTSGRLVGVI